MNIPIDPWALKTLNLKMMRNRIMPVICMP